MRNAILAFSIFLPLFAYGVASAETTIPLSTIEGTGTHFAVTDSDYLPITLESSESITMRLESVPNIVTLSIDAATSSATTTAITMSGFLPNTTYYKYSDSYHNLTQLTTDAVGSYTYTQDITTAHIIFIQPHKSTKFISDNATGGDCASVGMWNGSTKTCTLTQNISETVQIDSDNITLDGNNFSLTGFHTGSGIYMNGRSSVTLKNLTITNFSYGVSIYNSSNNHIQNIDLIRNTSSGISLSNSHANTITGNTVSLSTPLIYRSQGFILFTSGDNRFENNTINLGNRASNPGHQGILLFSGSNNNSFISNTVSSVYQGILLFDSSNSIFTMNTLVNTYQGIMLFNSSNTVFHENTFQDNQSVALTMFSPSTGNQVYNNNFFQNGTHVANYAGVGNVFNFPRPDGGNYWDTFDVVAEGCADANTDGFCDVPRVFTGGQDNLPWTMQDGWKSLTSQAPTLSFATDTPLGLYEDDGIQDHKGTAGKTHFTFSVIYTDAENRAPEHITTDIMASSTATTTILGMYPDVDNASSTLRDGDYRNGEAYVATSTFVKDSYSYFFTATTSASVVRLPDTGTFSFKTGYSNVAFLPGIMGSRIYWTDPSCILVNCENKLWIPNRNDDVEKLYMATGTSLLSNIYTKEDDILLRAGPDNSNFYQTLADEMNGLVASGTIDAWKPIAYDWRYGYDHLLSGGLNVDGKIYYDVPTSFPYILEELNTLVASSRTGKVTIIAHSNGGLLAKTLIQKLKDTGHADLADNLILVASPQLGTPEAIGALLHGYDEKLMFRAVAHHATQRKLAHDMPMTYNLLPSEKYLSTISTPVITFDEDVPANTLWGDEINNTGEYLAYLLGGDSRPNPDFGELEDPAIANETLLTSALEWHVNFDDWTAPTTTTVYQIAGWGNDTVSGIRYSNDAWLSDFSWDYEPILTEDGDGTVVTPSALANDGQKYWLNLVAYGNDNVNVSHAKIFEVPQLRTLIANIIRKEDISNPGQYISTTRPSAVNFEKRLRYFLHSPLTLELYDAQNRHVGVSTTTGQIEEQIPGASYDEFGEVKYISVPASASTTLIMRGEGEGRFTLNIQEVTGGIITATTTFANIPVSTSTLVTMSVPENPNLSTLPGLSIDQDGNGTIDTYVSPGTVLVPDITPPELQISFDASTRQLQFVGLDTSSTSVMSSATSTTAIDTSGNTLQVSYLQHKEKNRRVVLSFNTLVYNGSTTTIATTTLKYKWKTDASGKFTMFAVFIKTGNTTVEAHYRPRKNQTIIMSKPTDFDDSDSDDDCDNQPTKMKLQGLVIPGVQTSGGSINIIY